MSKDKNQPAEKVEYYSLRTAIEKCIDKPLSKVPSKLQKRIINQFPVPWDDLTVDQRIHLAVQLDCLKDPALRNIQERGMSLGFRRVTVSKQLDRYKWRAPENSASEERERRKLVAELEKELLDIEYESLELASQTLFEDEQAMDSIPGKLATEEVGPGSEADEDVSSGNAKKIKYQGNLVRLPTKKGSVTRPETFREILDRLAFWSDAEEALINEGKRKIVQKDIANRLAVLLKAKGKGDHPGHRLLDHYKQVKSANPEMEFLWGKVSPAISALQK